MTARDELAALRRELEKERLDHVTTLGQCQEAQTEAARLRRELETMLEVAREIGDERNELARQLGEEVATTQRLRAALCDASFRIRSLQHPGIVANAIDAALASGNGK